MPDAAIAYHSDCNMQVCSGGHSTGLYGPDIPRFCTELAGLFAGDPGSTYGVRCRWGGSLGRSRGLLLPGPAHRTGGMRGAGCAPADSRVRPSAGRGMRPHGGPDCGAKRPSAGCVGIAVAALRGRAAPRTVAGAGARSGTVPADRRDDGRRPRGRPRRVDLRRGTGRVGRRRRRRGLCRRLCDVRDADRDRGGPPPHARAMRMVDVAALRRGYPVSGLPGPSSCAGGLLDQVGRQ